MATPKAAILAVDGRIAAARAFAASLDPDATPGACAVENRRSVPPYATNHRSFRASGNLPERREAALAVGRGVVFRAIDEFWRSRYKTGGWPLRDLVEVEMAPCSGEASSVAALVGEAASGLDVTEAAYRIGGLYTALMPRQYRSQRGAYYTPPALCEQLLNMATAAGVDWAAARVLDPACGGGAFLAPVARRMAEALRHLSAEGALREIERRLMGFEVDPFAAWMSQVFLDAALQDLSRRAGRRIQSVVKVCDTLEQVPGADGYDLVVGNPPYGRVTLPPPLRRRFAASLFGHANLYGVFTDQALRLTKQGGLIAYVTPTSFLAGEYFKALRGLLAREAPPTSIAFVGARKGVFADALQETMLAVYRRGGAPVSGPVRFLSVGLNGSMDTSSAGSFHLPKVAERPWLMPRTNEQHNLLRRIGRTAGRLADLGYTVSTGPLVWNRHRESLREMPSEGSYPLVWAESVRADGRFEFRATKRNHQPYFEPRPEERWVVTNFPCVLLQRTTAKEQCRRLIAAELPTEFLDRHGAVVVENHLNMIRARTGKPKVSPATLAAVLNSDLVDQLFRCISGSVAVSAYELEALPLPPAEAIADIEWLVNRGAGRDAVERAVVKAYGHEGA